MAQVQHTIICKSQTKRLFVNLLVKSNTLISCFVGSKNFWSMTAVANIISVFRVFLFFFFFSFLFVYFFNKLSVEFFENENIIILKTNHIEIFVFFLFELTEFNVFRLVTVLFSIYFHARPMQCDRQTAQVACHFNERKKI